VLLVSQVVAQPVKASGGLGTFERYLSVWVALCMVAGVVLGS
jgi:ACR3 family arsenite transporter